MVTLKHFAMLAAIFLLAAAMFAGPFLFAAADKDGKAKATESARALKGLPTRGLSEDEAILQALNRDKEAVDKLREVVAFHEKYSQPSIDDCFVMSGLF